MSFTPAKKFCSGVSKIADFRHVDMEGQMKGDLSVWGAAPSEDDVEGCVSENFQKSVSTLPQFLHRRAAGNIQPLTGGEADIDSRE